MLTPLSRVDATRITLINIITSMGHKTDHWMSTGHLSVQRIELLHRGGKGQWGMYGYMYMGCYTHGGLVRCIEHGNAKPYLLINNFYNKRSKIRWK